MLQEQEAEIDALHEENLRLQQELKQAKRVNLEQKEEIERLTEDLEASRKREHEWRLKCGKLKAGLGRVKEMNLAINGLIDKGLDSLDKESTSEQTEVKTVKTEDKKVASQEHCRRSERIFLSASAKQGIKTEPEVQVTSPPSPPNKKTYQCKQCPIKFYHEYRLKRHLKKKHGNLNRLNETRKSLRVQKQPEVKTEIKTDEYVSSSNEQKKHDVDHSREHEGHFCICGARTSSQITLKMHVRYHTVGKNFKCPKCPLRSYSISNLNIHMKKIHKMSYKKANGCGDCGATFQTRAKCWEHMKDTHNKGPLTATRGRKSSAVKVEIQEDPPVAEVIPETITIDEEDTLITDQVAAAALLSLKTEVDMKPLRRNREELDFASPKPVIIKLEDIWYDDDQNDESSLEIVEVSHNDENMEVDDDPLSLSTMDLDLSSLEMEHGEVVGSKLRCLCGMEFGCGQALRTHIRTKMGVKPFKCQVCSIRFPRVDYMKRHVQDLHGIVIPSHLVWCRDCGENFESREVLIQHRFDIHKNGPKAGARRKRRKMIHTERDWS